MSDQEQAFEDAVRALSTRVARVAAVADPDAFAREFMTAARAKGWTWRPPHHNPTKHQVDAETARAATRHGAELARDLLGIGKDRLAETVRDITGRPTEPEDTDR